MHISADYIPPEEMHLVRWYLPMRPGVKWYYHRYHGQIDSSLQTPIELVDPSLRPIIRRLNEAGLPTLASCEGHWLSEEEFIAILEQLRRDEKAIRTKGLKLLDLHTGETIHYVDRNYRRPEEDELRRQVYDHQGIGFYSYLENDQIVFVRLDVPRLRSVR